MDDDSEGSRGRRLDPVAGGSGEESEAESASAPPPQREASTSKAGGGDDAFLDAVRGVSDEAAAAPAPAPAPALVVEEAFDQYAPAAAPSTSATTPAAPAALAAAAPPKPPPLGSLSRLASSSVSAAEEEAKAEAKRAADGFLVEHGRLSYSILLGLGSAFYPCAACCSPAGPKKPADGRGGRDDLV